MKVKILIILHLLIMLISWFSWLFISWKFLSFGSLIYLALLESFDGCFLSHMQFNDKSSNNTKFYEWWFGKIGIKNYNRKKTDIFMRYWLIVIIVLLALITQEICGFKVLF